MDFIILGRKIGTYSGWDQGDTFAIQVYDFEPLEGVNLPKVDCLTFELGTGKASWMTKEISDEENWKDFYKEVDFLPLIAHIPFTDLEDKENSND